MNELPRVDSPATENPQADQPFEVEPLGNPDNKTPLELLEEAREEAKTLTQAWPEFAAAIKYQAELQDLIDRATVVIRRLPAQCPEVALIINDLNGIHKALVEIQGLHKRAEVRHPGDVRAKESFIRTNTNEYWENYARWAKLLHDAVVQGELAAKDRIDG